MLLLCYKSAKCVSCLEIIRCLLNKRAFFYYDMFICQLHKLCLGFPYVMMQWDNDVSWLCSCFLKAVSAANLIEKVCPAKSKMCDSAVRELAR